MSDQHYTSEDMKRILQKSADERTELEQKMLAHCAQKFFVGKTRNDVVHDHPRYVFCFDLWKREQKTTPDLQKNTPASHSGNAGTAAGEAIRSVIESSSDEQVGEFLNHGGTAEMERVEEGVGFVKKALVGAAIVATGVGVVKVGGVVEKALRRVHGAAAEKNEALQKELPPKPEGQSR